MDELLRLGFIPSRQVNADQYRGALAEQGIAVPPDYLDFMRFTHPGPVNFGFKFHSADDNAEWEGQVTEFADYSQSHEDLLQALIGVQNRPMLPIAVDAGGNNILLSLDESSTGVYDLNYSTGTLSEIAPSFEAFVSRLYPID
jgi:SMI1 / KNR4 family (SUKH-1)